MNAKVRGGSRDWGERAEHKAGAPASVQRVLILVDTPIWIDHLHKGVAELAELLESGQVLTHPLVIGELACGGMKNREEFLRLVADSLELAYPEQRHTR